MIFDAVRDLVTYNWFTLAVAYLVILFSVYTVAYWIGGHRWGLVVERTLGLPILAVAEVTQGVYRVLTWPWRYRTHRLFQETFNISWHTDNYRAQAAVMDKLAYLWRQSERYAADNERHDYWLGRWHDARRLAEKRGLTA